jgi:hypothetical protein
VIDVGGRGVAEVRVQFEPATYSGFGSAAAGASARTAADGTFRIRSPRRPGRLIATGEGYVTLVPVTWFGFAPEPPVVVVVATPCELSGRVTDELGRPLEATSIVVMLTPGPGWELPVEVATFGHLLARGATRAEGTFSLPGIPCVDGVTVFVHREGYSTTRLAPAERGWTGLEIRLERDDRLVTVTGVVLGPAGGPVVGARVAAGETVTDSDSLGRFSVACAARGDRAAGWAAAPGLGSDVVWIDLDSRDAVEGVTLVLGGVDHSIKGVVVDELGAPQAGCLVSVLESTPIGRTSRQVGELTFEQSLSVEQILADSGPGTEDPSWVHCDAEGSFTIRPLADREYTVLVVRPDDLASAAYGPVAVDRNELRLVLPGLESSRVAGRVRAPDGTPLEGCVVAAELEVSASGSSDLHEVRLPSGTAASTRTDADGRFVLEGLRVEGVALSIVGPQLVGETRISLDELGDPAHLDIVVPVSGQFRLSFAGDTRPDFDGLRVESEEGEALLISFEFMGATVTGLAAPCPGGRTGVITVDSSARRLVLTSQGTVVRTLPLDLVAGGLTVVEVP